MVILKDGSDPWRGALEFEPLGPCIAVSCAILGMPTQKLKSSSHFITMSMMLIQKLYFASIGRELSVDAERRSRLAAELRQHEKASLKFDAPLASSG